MKTLGDAWHDGLVEIKGTFFGSKKGTKKGALFPLSDKSDSQGARIISN